LVAVGGAELAGRFSHGRLRSAQQVQRLPEESARSAAALFRQRARAIGEFAFAWRDVSEIFTRAHRCRLAQALEGALGPLYLRVEPVLGLPGVLAQVPAE